MFPLLINKTQPLPVNVVEMKIKDGKDTKAANDQENYS